MLSWLRPRQPRATITGLLAGVFWLSPGSALAAPATYYAAPNAIANSLCDAQHPCPVTTATAKATFGDTVIMYGDRGTYQTPQSPTNVDLHVPAGVTLMGAPGQPMPVWYSASSDGFGVQMDSQGSKLANLDIEYSYSPGVALFAWGTVDRVVAHATAANDEGCSAQTPTTLTNSVCQGKDAGFYDSVGGGSWTLTLRNDLLYGANQGLVLADSGGSLDATLTNTIARTTGASDITASNLGGSVSVTADHSNYSSVNALGATVTPTNTNGNQSAMPLFVNATAGNFAEAAGSPTINAGADSPANGPLDLAGLPRKIGPHTDIGPYERVLAPSVATGKPSAVANRVATINGHVNPNEAATTFQVRYGRSVTLGSFTAPGHLQAGVLALPVSVRLNNLEPGTTYHYRLVAGNFAGSTVGPDRTFTTRPDTKISHVKIGSGTAVFKFKAVGHAIKLQCSLHRRGAKAKFRKCRSPKRYTKLTSGKYTFEVRAVGPSGADPRPAKKKVRIH